MDLIETEVVKSVIIWYGKCAYNERNDVNTKHSLIVSLKTTKIERVLRRSIVSEHIWY